MYVCYKIPKLIIVKLEEWFEERLEWKISLIWLLKDEQKSQIILGINPYKVCVWSSASRKMTWRIQNGYHFNLTQEVAVLVIHA